MITVEFRRGRPIIAGASSSASRRNAGAAGNSWRRGPGIGPSQISLAYEVQAGVATPVASPAEFPGPIISLGSSSDGSAIAVVANLMTGQYEAYRVSVYCGR